MKAAARANRQDIIDFGIGIPDHPSSPHVMEKLIEAVQNSRTRRYFNSRGIPGLRRAVADYYDRRFGVEIDPERETIVTLRSKEGFAKLAMGIDFLAELKRAERYSVASPLAVVLNFPANPTGHADDFAFYNRVVGFCQRDVLIDSFAAAGWTISPPSASMFAGAPIPQQFSNIGSLDFLKVLLSKTGVAVSPGVGFGQYGEGYVRIALVETRYRICKVARGMKRILSGGRDGLANQNFQIIATSEG